MTVLQEAYVLLVTIIVAGVITLLQELKRPDHRRDPRCECIPYIEGGDLVEDCAECPIHGG